MSPCLMIWPVRVGRTLTFFYGHHTFRETVGTAVYQRAHAVCCLPLLLLLVAWPFLLLLVTWTHANAKPRSLSSRRWQPNAQSHYGKS
jgi:hypothetical protein